MKKNGFITPLVLMISFILFSTLLYEIKVLDQERSFLIEEKEMFILDQLLQMGTVDMLDTLSAQKNFENGSFIYEKGTVSYSVISKSDEEIGISLKAVTTIGRKNGVNLYYNLMTQTLVDWKEI